MKPMNFTNGIYKYVAINNSQWIIVFHHNIVKTSPFTSEEETLFSLTDQKYSILGHINDEHKYDGKFEFIVYYPEPKLYLWWRQSKNPVYDYEVQGIRSAEGFEPIYNSSYIEKWGGLVRSTIKDSHLTSIGCFLDGNPGIYNWWFTIGANDKVGTYVSKNQFPGPDNVLVSEVILLMRVHIVVLRGTCTKNSSKFSLIYLVIFVNSKN